MTTVMKIWMLTTEGGAHGESLLLIDGGGDVTTDERLLKACNC